MGVEDLELWLDKVQILVQEFPTADVWYLLKPLVLTTVSVYLVYIILRAGTADRPKRYTVPPPRFPEGEPRYLERPSIKLEGSTAIQCYAPATGQFLGLVNPSTPAGLDRAIAAAATAQKKWAAGTTFAQRRAVLRTLLAHVLENQEQICRVSSLDSGKTMVDAQLGEILVTAEKLQWTISHGERALRPSRRPTNLLMAYKRNRVEYEPLGVVAALVSWNYPFHNLMGPIIAALFAGNGIVVKVSEQTCWSAAYYTSIARGALVAHGHDPALVQTAVCWPQVASHLTSHEGVSHITFIGSRPVCQQVALSAAKRLTPLVAELGGKDAAVVCESAAGDLGRVAEVLMRGTFQASGQNCIGIERIVAAPAVYDRLVEMLAPKVKALRMGVDKDVGAMVSGASFSRLESLISDAVAGGARLLAGGRRYAHPDHPAGFYFAPTLLVDVTPDMAVAREECFGPIMTVLRAASGSAADLLAVANAGDLGLGASVWGGDADPVVREVVKGVRAGGVAVNDFAVYYAVQLPFGGVGASGYGRFAGEEGLRGLCNLKSVCEDRLGWLGVRTAIPRPVRYPVADQDRSWRFTRGIVTLGYGLGVGGKAKGLGDIVRNA